MLSLPGPLCPRNKGPAPHACHPESPRGPLAHEIKDTPTPVILSVGRRGDRSRRTCGCSSELFDRQTPRGTKDLPHSRRRAAPHLTPSISRHPSNHATSSPLIVAGRRSATDRSPDRTFGHNRRHHHPHAYPAVDSRGEFFPATFRTRNHPRAPGVRSELQPSKHRRILL